jgi:hypothetical protein
MQDLNIRCIIHKSSLIEYFYKHTLVIQDEKHIDPLIEFQDDSWLLYSSKDLKHKTSLIPPTLPLKAIKPIVDPLTLYYVKNSLVMPCFDLLKTTMEIDFGIVEENKEIVITNIKTKY